MKYLAQRCLLVFATLTLGFAFSTARTASAAPGDLDPGFDGDGKVTTNLGPSYSQEYVHKLLLQPDGKIVAVGYIGDPVNPNFALTRYHAGGSLDATFGNGGIVISDFTGRKDVAYDAALQPDGKIVVVGDSRASQSPLSDFIVARYNSNGTLDTSFGSGGHVITELGGLDRARALVLQPDGKIVVGGGAGNTTQPHPGGNFALVRYHTNGDIDTSFGSNGIINTNLGGNDLVNGLALQPDGKLIAAGHSAFENESERAALARYTAGGELDPSFSNGGEGSAVAQFFGFKNIILTPDNKILLSSGFTVLRLTNNGVGDGNIDYSFGTNGVASNSFPGAFAQGAGNIVLHTDGKIYAGGYFGTGINTQDEFDFALVRFNGDGSTDTTFGNGNGRASADFNGFADLGHTMLVQPDGLIVIAGSADPPNNNGTDFGLARFLNGTNLSPSVAITSPSSGTTFLPATNIPINADASDADGSIARVDFYANDELIGTATESPYTVNWNVIIPGNYTLTAVATDDAGLSTTSTPVTVTIGVSLAKPKPRQQPRPPRQ